MDQQKQSSSCLPAPIQASGSREEHASSREMNCAFVAALHHNYMAMTDAVSQANDRLVEGADEKLHKAVCISPSLGCSFPSCCTSDLESSTKRLIVNAQLRKCQVCYTLNVPLLVCHS